MLVAEFEPGDLWDSVENWVYSGLARGVPGVAKYFVPNRGENKLVSTLLFMYCYRLNAAREADTFLRRSSRSNWSREREREIERHIYTCTHTQIQCSFIVVDNCEIWTQYCKSKLLRFEITCGAFDVTGVALVIKFSYFGAPA